MGVKSMNTRKWLYFLLILIIALETAGCSLPGPIRERNKVKLKVIIAGSLLVPFQSLEKEFEKANPDIDLLLEGHGSVQVIRSVTELNNKADIVAVADDHLIPLMMYSAEIPESSKPYADWCIKFATNKLGIAYKPESAYSSEINANNWYSIISRPDVIIGLADPRIDAMGYRTLMSMQLAEDYYHDQDIFEKCIGSAFNPPISIINNSDLSRIKIPEIVRSTKQKVKLRSYSIQLMALLESGDIDYSFEYESVARQRGLKFLSLPEGIDLSNSDYEKQYQKVKVSLDFKRFASVVPDFEGRQIVYGLTIPNNAFHPEEASRFIKFILGQNGQRIFNQSYQPFLVNPKCDDVPALPEDLKLFFGRIDPHAANAAPSER